MTIDLCTRSRDGLGGGGACLASPSLHLPESGDGDALRRIRGDTVPSWSRAGGGKVKRSGVIKSGCVGTTDMTKGAEVEGVFLEL